MKVKLDPLFIVAIVVHPFFLHCSEQFLVLMFCVDYKFLNDLFNSILLWRWKQTMDEDFIQWPIFFNIIKVLLIKSILLINH